MWKHKILDRSLCLLQVYAPNATSEYYAFLDEVNDALLRVSLTESIVLMGDLTHVGRDTDTWKGVMGDLVYHLSSDNFLMYSRTSRRNGCCSDQRSFHQLLKVVGENGLELRAIDGKEHLGGTKWLKKLFEQRKMHLRPCYRTDRHLICNPGTLRREKRQLQQ